MKPMNRKFYLIAIFEYLDMYFHKGYEEELAVLLSSLNPIGGWRDPHITNMPSDPAMYEIWCEILENIDIDQLDHKAIYPYVIKFINYVFKRGLPEMKDFIEKEKIPNKKDEKVWLRVVQSVQEKIGTVYN